MSREILFRGKSVRTNEWVYGDLKQISNKFGLDLDAIIHDYIDDEVYKKTIGQYTGLADKKGIKIFEGDILKNNITDSKCIVNFYDTRFMLNYPDRLEEVEMHCFLHRIPTMFEIIGNIYDNPELIKK